MAPVTAIMDAISLLFSVTYNALLHAYGLSPADKIEERINIALCHVRLYLADNMMIETTSLPPQTHSIYPVVVEDLDLDYKPSLSLLIRQ